MELDACLLLQVTDDAEKVAGLRIAAWAEPVCLAGGRGDGWLRRRRFSKAVGAQRRAADWALG
jgi:hypothetical protein